jgi:hypothetical protein
MSRSQLGGAIGGWAPMPIQMGWRMVYLGMNYSSSHSEFDLKCRKRYLSLS